MPFWLFFCLVALMLLLFATLIRRKSRSTPLKSEVIQVAETKIDPVVGSTVRDKGKEKEDIQQETKEEKHKRLEAAARIKDATAQAIRNKQSKKKLGEDIEIPIAGLPPGQKLSKRWVVLDIAGIHKPVISPEAWKLSIKGEVENPVVLDYALLMKLAKEHSEETNISTAMLCVTGWTTLGLELQGVPFSRIVEIVRPKDSWRFLIQKGIEGYSTSLARECVEGNPKIYLVYGHNGQPLPAEHGGPVRVMVDGLYGYKSTKWVRKIKFSVVDKTGVGEARGYHPRGDIWKEERLIEDSQTEEEKEKDEASEEGNAQEVLELVRQCKEEGKDALQLNGKKMVTIPQELLELTHLDSLWLNSNRLTSLPREFFFSFRNLFGLSLQNNRLEELPPEIGEMKYLGELWANNNQITAIPDALFENCTELVVIALDKNRIEYLSPSVGRLTGLVALMMDNNRLTGLPKELASCTKMNLLQVRGNQFKEIPTELHQLAKLEWFGIDDGVNGLSSELISEGAEAIRQALNEQHSANDVGPTVSNA